MFALHVSKNKESETNVKYFKLEVHSFCMDNEAEHVTLFTYHVIRSPELLKNKYLKKEREISYESFSYPDTQKLQRTMFQNVYYPYAIRGIYEPYRLAFWFHGLYLVPPEDMAFPLFRKATYHTGNMTHAWQNIINVYKIIHERLRLLAMHKNQELIEINGVKDVLKLGNKTIMAGHHPLPKYIWTVVYNPDKTENIAIVIHNIPHKYYFDEVEKLCETSTCRIQEWDITLATDFTFAYCCDAEVITNIHNFPKADGKLEVEALYWPLVLVKSYDRYLYPKSFKGLDEPADDPEHEQINFCPAENVHESCLLPNNDSIPYCTKPIKYVWKIIENSDICFGRDMVDFSVRFQLCSEGSAIMKYLEVYRVCYHIKNKRTRFTYNELISPAVMNNRELDIQRSKKFSWDTNDYGLLNNDFKILENAFEKKKSGIFQEIAGKQSLERLMLTSPYQMPFASLIEPTYHYVNVIPAWEEIVHIWNAIDDHILKMALEKKQIFKHINGSSKEILQAFDGEKIYLDDEKLIPMSKYIWKVVYNQSMKQNVAIIIHNSSPDKISQPDKLCEPKTNLCSFLLKSDNFIYGQLNRFAYCCQGDVITEMYNLYKSSSSLIVGEIEYNWKHPDGNSS